MKKTYIIPTAEIIDLHVEAPILAGSEKNIGFGEGEKDAAESLIAKNIWKNYNWNEE